MDEDFVKLEDRAVALRITLPELVASVPDLSGPTFWRAKRGLTGTGARVRVLRKVEARLDQLEAERAS